MFTGVAVAQLAQQGKLSFHDPLIKHLPDYPKQEVAEKVTLHHLLTHTAGLGGCLDNFRFLPSRNKIRRVRDYFPLFVNEPQVFKPGEKYEYSNVGFIILGAVIEKVSGQHYFDYVRDHVFKPAGMNNTDFYELDRDTPNMAVGYEPALEGDRLVLLNKTHIWPLKGCPAGLGYSTAEDLLRFDAALRGHKLLNDEPTRTLLTGKVELAAGRNKYAYGFFDETVNGQRIVGHGGGFPGIDTSLDMYMDSGYTVVVLANRPWVTGQRVKYWLRELLTMK
jgi:CubicO group peptidase (beta-lactamase class C family)